MTERTRMLLLLVTGVVILTAVVFQERNKAQSLEGERSACSDQREKLSFEASELNQQVTQLKEKQRETEREFERCSRKLAALEESLEKLEDERTVWEDERDKHKIREKHLKQQLDDFRSQFKATESATNEGNVNSKDYSLLINEFKTQAVLRDNNPITGIAKLNEDIFAITSCSIAIERFDSATLLMKDSLWMTQYENLGDLQSCSRSQSLFVIDKESTGKISISNIDPYNYFKTINPWEVDRCVIRISVTEDCHVLATCYDQSKIIEYSSNGHLIQEIVLKPEKGIVYPRFALKMANGNFLVSYNEKNALGLSVFGVAIVNSAGKVLKFYSDPLKTSDMVIAMAIDGLGNILAAEMFSGRVMLLSPDLEYKRDIVTEEHGARIIRAMLLDEVNGRLFVADSSYNAEDDRYEDGRVLVFYMK